MKGFEIKASKYKGFQFYLSSIKRVAKAANAIEVYRFQFYLSSIKSSLNIKIQRSQKRFNSTLVQLKGSLSSLNVSNHIRFNSTLVQLKVVASLMPSLLLFLFQFYLSSIKSNPRTPRQSRLKYVSILP